MKSLPVSRFMAAVSATALLASSVAAAQMSVQKVAATNKVLQQVKSSIKKLSPSHRMALDGYANIAHLADVWQTYGMRLTDPSFNPRAAGPALAAATATTVSTGGLVRVSNPSSDVAYSSFGGFTQSETSTARCGNTVVVGYNDSGSVFETPLFYTGTGGQSFSGASYSTNGGLSFTDIGPINPGANDYNFLGGDPGVNCADPHTFYYSQIFDYLDGSGNPWAAISINTSRDGGQTGVIRCRRSQRMATITCWTSHGRQSILRITSASSSPIPTSILRRPTIAEKIIREGPRSSLCSRMTAV